MATEAADPLLTPGQARDVLAQHGLTVATTTFREWARQGRVRSEVMPSGRRRFRRSAVLAIVTGHQPTDVQPLDAA